eukprot:scaffold2235_cov201-Skeletonema_marinoi.AAC.7
MFDVLYGRRCQKKPSASLHSLPTTIFISLYPGLRPGNSHVKSKAWTTPRVSYEPIMAILDAADRLTHASGS